MSNTKQNAYGVITQQIIDRLEAGVVPWRQPWGGPNRMPRNLTSDRAYRGINVFLLAFAGYEWPYWLTFKQAKAMGGHVRKGERGKSVIFWNLREVARKNDRGDDETRKIPLIRRYTVFNVAQCEGIEVPEPRTATPFEPVAQCEAVLGALPDAPQMRTAPGRAYYAPTTDTVSVPPPWHFEAPPAYYATLFHELVHSTGHASRLARPGVTDEAAFGSHAYSKEELVAEMGAAFLCGHTGIEAATLDNQAAYIDNWLRALRGHAKLVVHAAAQAQKAADWLLGTTPNAAEA